MTISRDFIYNITMVSKAINNIVSDLKPRQKEIVSGRFGLLDGNKHTLASLGEKYGITRERVRQLEAEALKLISQNIGKTKLKDTTEEAIAHLKNVGGVRSEDYLVNDLRFILKDKNISHWHLRFLFEVFGKPSYYSEDDKFHSFWYLDDKSLKQAANLIAKLRKFLAGKKKELINHGKSDIVLSKIIEPHPLPDFIALNYLSVSKNFGLNNYGDFGLSEWEEIKPKTMKAKAYLVMRKNGKPMHFNEIAKAINEAGFDRKKALPQTVHNELIKYPEFILVGRGTYGLAESGYTPGTAKEVIAKILKSKGPLTADKIVDLVSQERFLKPNTILLNLQNKKHFKKLANGKYSLK